jgi:acetyl-CoA C-acetyltransferase
MLIRTGQFNLVAVEGHSKASNILTLPGVTAYAQDPVLNRPLRLDSHFIAGLEMNRFLFETGTTLEQCAEVVVKNRRNALKNPSAPYGADLSISEALSGPPIALPLTAHQTAEHADGAIVMVLASEERARTLSEKPIWVLGVGWINDSPSLESRTWGTLPYVQAAARMAYRQAGFRNPLQAIDFAEIDDTFAYRELQTLEALGICTEGTAGPLTEEGFTAPDGELPVNVSGGSLGAGNLLDATGLRCALEAVLQLRGEAGSRQLADVQIGLAQAWRGLPTTSTAVAVLSN